MKKMSALLLALALLTPAASAAPAPDRAKEALRGLKAKLPEVVKKWGKVYARSLGNEKESDRAELRLIRQISPTEAKITILIIPRDANFGDTPLTIYLAFYGSWTSTRFDCHGANNMGDTAGDAVRMLMLAIDELGEK